jgi:hypothetical protein
MVWRKDHMLMFKVYNWGLHFGILFKINLQEYGLLTRIKTMVQIYVLRKNFLIIFKVHV